jgi:hypothetical protein
MLSLFPYILWNNTNLRAAGNQRVASCHGRHGWDMAGEATWVLNFSSLVNDLFVDVDYRALNKTSKYPGPIPRLADKGPLR